MGRFVLLNLKGRNRLVVFSIITIGGFIISAILPYLNGRFVDMFVKYNQTVLMSFACIIAFLGIIGALIFYASNIILIKIIYQSSLQIIQKLCYATIHADLYKVSNYNSSYLTQRIITDSLACSKFVLSNFIPFFLNLITVIAIIFFVFYSNFIMGLLVVIGLCVYMSVLIFVDKPLKNASKKQKEADARFYGKVEELLKQIENIQFNSFQENILNLLRENCEAYLPYILKFSRISYLVTSIDGLIRAISQGALIIISSFSIKSGAMTVGEFVAINLYFSMLQNCVKYYIEIYKNYKDAEVSYVRIKELMSLTGKESSKNIIKEFQDLSIEANDGIMWSSDMTILQNFTYKFEEKYTYAIVGENGSGKTTLFRLIMNLYKFDTKIKINEENTDNINMDVFRKDFVSGVCQNLIKPELKVYEYMMLMIEVDNKSELISLISSSRLNSFKKTVLNLIDRSCTNLSEGEFKKVNILVAVLKYKKILVLDEPTTSLDYESTVELQRYIRENYFSQLIILITHDKSMLESVDKIIKL